MICGGVHKELIMSRHKYQFAHWDKKTYS